MPFLRFIAAFLVYAIIDIGWNVTPIARGMYDRLHETAGTDRLFDTFGKEMNTWAAPEFIALLVFLALIAWANHCLAIEPGVKENDLGKAMRNSFLLGCLRHLHRPHFPDAGLVARPSGAHRHPHRRPVEPDNLNRRHLVGAPQKRRLNFHLMGKN